MMNRTRVAFVEIVARSRYEESTANHPTIHCNRFLVWDELTEADRNEWRAKVCAVPDDEDLK